MNSIRARLLLAMAMLLAAFGTLSGLTIERAFTSALLDAQRDKLQTLVYSLLGAASVDDARDQLAIDIDQVPDPRLRQPMSGLEAALFDEQDRLIWHSGQVMPSIRPGATDVGTWTFERLSAQKVFTLSFGVRWVDRADDPRRYTIVVIEDAADFEQQARTFRKTLWTWFAGLLIALVGATLGLLRWGLAPLRRLGIELHRVETGEQQGIHGDYPEELQALTRDLNAMIVAERNQQTRYRDALGDLAHSLKTPLAVLRGLEVEASSAHVAGALAEQLSRMQHIVDHQLRRAAAAGRRTLTEPVELAALADKLIAALSKVYADKHPHFDNRIDPGLRIRIDAGDLYELLGNLLDNAAKYGHRQIRISAQESREASTLLIEDDGPGFPQEAESLLQRGARADTRLPGQGLGLAAVCDIVQAYGGRLRLERSDLGGARVRLALPPQTLRPGARLPARG